jgi:hypothetical protein
MSGRDRVAHCTLIIFSLGRTRIFWYVVPVRPLLAIAFAIGAVHGAAR